MRFCPLCCGDSVVFYHQDKRRCYFHCKICALIFVDTKAHLDPIAEKAIYQHHQNDPQDVGYRQFLNKLLVPLTAKIPKPPAEGLDFGAGPGPTLSRMLEEMGYTMSVYDPYFSFNPLAIKRTYDFVTCTEVLEHFCHPATDWPRLLACVKSGGWLGIMTRLTISEEQFSRWHYKNDPTHVSFFSRDTFEFLAKRDRLQLEFVGNDVILLRKSQ